jgi:hypothetical protein
MKSIKDKVYRRISTGELFTIKHKGMVVINSVSKYVVICESLTSELILIIPAYDFDSSFEEEQPPSQL